MTSLFFFQTQAGRHQFNAGVAATTTIHDHEIMMMDRANVAISMIDHGDSIEEAQHFYETGRFDGQKNLT